MKKIKMVVAASLLCMVFGGGQLASASQITWSADHIDNWSKVCNAGTLIEACNFGGGPTTTVNGVEFTSIAPGQNGTYIQVPSTVRTDYNHQTTYYAGPLTDPAGDALFDYMTWGDNSSQDRTYTLSGLTVGKTYMVQFMHVDDRYSSLYHVFDQGAANEFGDLTTTRADKTVDPLIVTGIFVADDTMQTFTTHSNGLLPEGWHCSAIQLREYPSKMAWTANHLDGWSKVSNAGTLVEACNFGGGPTTTVNGVEFTSIAPGGNGTYISTPTSSTIYSNYDADYYTGTLTGPAGDALFDYMAWGNPIDPNHTYTLSGLTVGKTYMVQFLHSDDRTTGDWYQVFDLGTETEFGDVVTTSHNAEVDPLIVTGIFVAGDTTQTFTTHTNGGTHWHCSAIQLRECVPLKAYEPTPANRTQNISVSQATLTWMPGTYAASHHVYFGTDYDEVYHADPNSVCVGDVDKSGSVNLNDLLVIADQWLTVPGDSVPSADLVGSELVNLDDFGIFSSDWKKSSLFRGNLEVNVTTYTPGWLDDGTTYYWRIDEINGPDVWKGDVWSFTTEDIVVFDQEAETDNIVYLMAAGSNHNDGLTVLYPTAYPKHFWINNFNTPSDYLTWKVYLETGAEYHVQALLNTRANEPFRLTVDNTAYSLNFETEITIGWDKLDAGTIFIPAGYSTLTLTRPSATAACEIKSLELMRESDRAAYLQRVNEFKADSSWFSQLDYGLMFQGGAWCYPPTGEKKTLEDQANDFDVSAFVNMVKNTGASYVIWSQTWWTYEMWAPNTAVDTIVGHSNLTATRDVIGELANALDDEGIAFFLYYHVGQDSHVGYCTTEWWQKQLFPTAEFTATGLGDRTVFFNNWMAVISEIGTRYGDKLDGWFFDDGLVYYPAPFEQLGQVARAGNPNRLICYNSWRAARYTDFQDVYMGEGHHGEILYGSAPEGGNGVFMEGPQKGLLQHGMFIMEQAWGVGAPNTTITTAISNTQAINWVQNARVRNVPLSFNMMIYEDGSVSQDSLNVLFDLKAALSQ